MVFTRFHLLSISLMLEYFIFRPYYYFISQ